MIDVSSDGYNIVTLSHPGPTTIHGPYLIWAAPTTAGSYDIVVDEDLDGYRDPGEKVDDSDPPLGFTVTAPPVVYYSVTFDAVATPPPLDGDVPGTAVIVTGTIGGVPFTVTKDELPKPFTGIPSSTTIIYTYTHPVPAQSQAKDSD